MHSLNSCCQMTPAAFLSYSLSRSAWLASCLWHASSSSSLSPLSRIVSRVFHFPSAPRSLARAHTVAACCYAACCELIVARGFREQGEVHTRALSSLGFALFPLSSAPISELRLPGASPFLLSSLLLGKRGIKAERREAECAKSITSAVSRTLPFSLFLWVRRATSSLQPHVSACSTARFLVTRGESKLALITFAFCAACLQHSAAFSRSRFFLT